MKNNFDLNSSYLKNRIWNELAHKMDDDLYSDLIDIINDSKNFDPVIAAKTMVFMYGSGLEV